MATLKLRNGWLYDLDTNMVMGIPDFLGKPQLLAQPSDITAILDAITVLQTEKADQVDLDTLTTVVDGKASQVDLTALAATVAQQGIDMATDADLAALAGVVAALTTVVETNVGQYAQTGDFKFNMRASGVPTGWVAADGSTIGNIGSGATRANVDTQALFVLWWEFADAVLPILTSAGGASTRGASAMADWAALKRLTVFDARDQFLRAASVARAPGTLQAASRIQTDTVNDTILRQPHANTLVAESDGTVLGDGNIVFVGGATNSGVVANQNFEKVRPANIGVSGFWKL